MADLEVALRLLELDARQVERLDARAERDARVRLERAACRLGERLGALRRVRLGLHRAVVQLVLRVLPKVVPLERAQLRVVCALRRVVRLRTDQRAAEDDGGDGDARRWRRGESARCEGEEQTISTDADDDGAR